MKCEAVRESIGAWLDGELEEATASALEAHLADCAACRSLAGASRTQNAELSQAFAARRAAAERVAERVIEQLSSESASAEMRAAAFSHAAHTARWGEWLLAAAAGFLLAVVLLRPWPMNVAALPGAVDKSGSLPTDEPPVATLTVATGDVELRVRDADAWQALAEPPGQQCPVGSMVRTGPGVRCELRTSDGCVIRLNHETEITLKAGNAIEIQRGQIWCSSPENISLKVMSAAAGGARPPATAAKTMPKTNPPNEIAPGVWLLTCPANSCMLTEVERDADVQVTTSQGEVEVQTVAGTQRLQQGETVSIVAGDLVKSGRASDPILAANWIQSLLVRKGHGNAELGARVDQLLARMGQSKLDTLYEQEIRSLGEYAVLPLLRYVQSPLSLQEPARRQTALAILSDIAPSWTIGDLIKLLADDDEVARLYAATALRRLTGLDHGRLPAQWREDREQCAPTVELWDRWWAENQDQYPPPAASGLTVGTL